MLDKQVVVGKDRLPGVIGSKPIHLQDRDEPKQVVKFEDLVIDVGASSKDDLEGRVSIGDVAAFKVRFCELDANPDGLRPVLGEKPWTTVPVASFSSRS